MRGRARHGFDFELQLEWTLSSLSSAASVTGKALLPDASRAAAEDELDALDYTFSPDRASAAAADAAAAQALAAAGPALRAQALQALVAFNAELAAKAVARPAT